MAEVGGRTVVRIRDAVVIILGEISVQPYDLSVQFRAGGQSAQPSDVVGIHGHNVVGVFKVSCGDGARTMRKVIAPCGGTLPHAAIGQLAFMIVNEAGRVNFKSFFGMVPADDVAEYSLGCR